MDMVLYGVLKKKIDNMGIDESKIKPILEEFFLEHPEYMGATEEQVEQINSNTTNITEILADLEEITADDIDEWYGGDIPIGDTSKVGKIVSADGSVDSNDSINVTKEEE